MKNKIAVYGFGSTGKKVIDNLLLNNFEVTLIIDKNVRGEYKNIPIIDLEILKNNFDYSPCSLTCIIALHNHYIDIKSIFDLLVLYGFSSVHTIVSFNHYIKKFNTQLEIENSYWYESDFSNENFTSEIHQIQNIFADEKSVNIFLSTIKYREFGNLNDCPMPSLIDEYIPYDLPKHQQPIRLIDCGAHTGSSIERIYYNGYEIESILAFEPNLINFKILSEKNFGSAETTYLPLGLSRTNEILSFSTTLSDSTSGRLGGNSNEFIQCVRLDSVIKNQSPNLILFDIEGAEFDALLGMKEIIKLSRPTLCVSLYHCPDDIYRIPLLIHEWNLNYKFYLRVHEYNTFGLILYCYQD